jgi:hypothetical protein
MPLAGVMQMSVHQVIDMVAMGYGFVAASRTMLVTGLVPGTGVLRGATSRIGCVHRDRVFVVMAFVRMVQVAVVQVVDVVVMPDGGVPAAFAVAMRM